MATLHKFKLLTPLQCATAISTSPCPSPSPSPSPPRISTSDSITPYCFHFGQKLSLKRLLRRRFFVGRQNLTVDRSLKEGLLTSNKLKDMFASSPPPPPRGSVEKFEGVSGFGSLMGRVEEYPVRQQRRRFGVVGLRYRLFRGAWRPRLGAIPE